MSKETFLRMILPILLVIAGITLAFFRNKVTQALIKGESVIGGMWMFGEKGKLRFAQFLVYLILTFLFIYALMLPFADFEWHKFNSESWKIGESFYSDVPTRSSMVDDLLGSYKLKGMDREGVLDLLGEPSFTEGGDAIYWIGTGFHCFMPDLDSESWLRIRFKNDMVTETKILSDCGGHGFDSVKND